MLCLISAYTGTSGSLFKKNKNAEFNYEQEKELCENGIEKSIPQVYHLSLLSKSCDANAILPMDFAILPSNSYEPVHEIFNNVVCATSKASDQPARTRSLIRNFASRLSIL